LLTPNWQSRLPGHGYEGDDPDGFRTMAETIAFIERYATLVSPPLRTHCPVASVRSASDGYQVVTVQDTWHCKVVVLATGAFNIAQVPKLSEEIPSGIAQLTTAQYRNPESLDPGGVMVVGAAASGAQIAGEIQRSGRPVTLAVGEHVRAPRMYRATSSGWTPRAERRNAHGVGNLRRAAFYPRSDRRLYRPAQHRSECAHSRVLSSSRLAVVRWQGPVLSDASQSVRLPISETAAEHVRWWAANNGVSDAVDPPHRPERRGSKHRLLARFASRGIKTRLGSVRLLLAGSRYSTQGNATTAAS
jgi:cation diffusion facilitator CzcD-associated flavoprotein CzcO